MILAVTIRKPRGPGVCGRGGIQKYCGRRRDRSCRITPCNAFVGPKHFPAALLSEGKRPQKPLQLLFSWKVSNRNAAARNKKLLGSMTFARREKECFDSCEQNNYLNPVWTCLVVVRCQNLIFANVGTSSTRPILFRHLKCPGQVRYGPMLFKTVKNSSGKFDLHFSLHFSWDINTLTNLHP